MFRIILLISGVLVANLSAQEIVRPGDDCAPLTDCALSCDYGLAKDEYGCPVCQCGDNICKDVICSIGRVCMAFTLSLGHEVSRCVDPRLPIKCLPPFDSGRCKKKQQMYFYNTETDHCEAFIYGGCQGNDNRFAILETCQTTCVPQAECPELYCDMFCEDGLASDEMGCPLCACADPLLEELLASPVCGHLTCPFCPNGYVKDASGCDTCQCDCSDREICQIYCDNGFQKDQFGCDICQCDCSNRENCMEYCEYGHEQDGFGCDVCTCRNKSTPARCPEVMCAMYCDTGFLKDRHGCDICKCNPRVCPDIQDCALSCTYGFKMDLFNCDVCRCQKDPCKAVDCPAGKKCIVHNSFPKCVDMGARDWCRRHEVMCQVFCEHGFQTSEDGCEICFCRDKPQTLSSQCPPLDCNMDCMYGFAFDSDGCQYCKCLEDPCTYANMCTRSQVCETRIHPDCPECPASTICLHPDQVQRMLITVHYLHEEVEDFDEAVFAEMFLRRMTYLLNIDQTYLKGVTVEQPDDLTTVMSFYVVSYGVGNLVETFETFQLDIQLHSEGTSIKYQNVIFVPEHERVFVSYYEDPEFDVDDDDLDDDLDDDDINLGVIIGCSVAGAVALIAIVAIVILIVKSKKMDKHDRPNVAYQRQPSKIVTPKPHSSEKPPLV